MCSLNLKFYKEQLIVKCFCQLLHRLYPNRMLLLVLFSKFPFPAVDIYCCKGNTADR